MIHTQTSQPYLIILHAIISYHAITRHLNHLQTKNKRKPPQPTLCTQTRPHTPQQLRPGTGTIAVLLRLYGRA